MKHIFLNLKRFDIPKEYGGVNSIAAVKDWGSCIVEQTQKGLMEYGTEDVEFAMFFPKPTYSQRQGLSAKAVR